MFPLQSDADDPDVLITTSLKPTDSAKAERSNIFQLF